ncbi:homeodomain transcription factor [Mycena pura]|uniref:Homeodomain transcription factor n=1 Tax=Mycena pura TaxID=153505 RepID=A0AAD6YPE1_9AGAR|nr:homeodomain transcription factor [Mycena pura]
MPPAKRPRHRHTPAQLAALNNLYSQTDNPTLPQRTELAIAIGLETKSVNSYFANKRSSTRKRLRELSTPTSPNPVVDTFSDDLYHSPSAIATQNIQSQIPPPSESPSEPESMHTASDELRKDSGLAQYITTDEGQATSKDIEMLLQDQHTSTPKKDEDYSPPAVKQDHASPPFPPGLGQPTLTERGRRSASAFSVPDEGLTSRSRRDSSRSDTPYNSTCVVMPLSTRPRRSRPDPSQLTALKRLFNKTSTPSIEERSALAYEIGMDLGKVTNWFRNLRQSARKRDKRIGRRRGGGSDDDFDYTDGYGTGFYSPSVSASASRAGTPSSSLERQEDGQRSRRRLPARLHPSDDEDEDEDEEESQEAVTPSPSQSPPPSSLIFDLAVAAALHDAWMQMVDYPDPSLAADALLLLEFQATCK